MKISAYIYSLALSSALVLGSHQVFAGAIISELSDADQAKIKSGEQVAIYTKSSVPDAPWPDCRVYQWVKASPEEAVAAFADYELQVRYIPNLSKSQVSKRDKRVAHVDYTINLPMGFGAESYTAIDTLSTYDAGASYKVDWTVIPTTTIKQSVGDARFEALETSLGKGTLIAYYNFIFPVRWGSSLGWVVERAKKTVADNLTAIVKQVNTEVKEREGGSKQLDDQIKNLRDTLAQ